MCKPERHAHRSGDTSFKFTNTISSNQDSMVWLRCACSHLFDKVCILGHQQWSRCTCWSCIATGRCWWWYHWSMGIPHSHPSFTLSKTQASLKEPFSNSADCFSNFYGSFVSPPPFVDQMGMNVKLTWAMCPMMRVLWVFSFATWLRLSGGFHNTCVLVENQLLARSTIFTIYQVPIYMHRSWFSFEYILNFGIILDLQNIWKEEFGTPSPSFI